MKKLMFGLFILIASLAHAQEKTKVIGTCQISHNDNDFELPQTVDIKDTDTYTKIITHNSKIFFFVTSKEDPYLSAIQIYEDEKDSEPMVIVANMKTPLTLSTGISKSDIKINCLRFESK